MKLRRNTSVCQTMPKKQFARHSFESQKTAPDVCELTEQTIDDPRKHFKDNCQWPFKCVSSKALGLNRAVLCDKAEWIPNHSRDACVCCMRKFRPWFRKHHCRVCGEIVCGLCSVKKIRFANESVRSCDKCIDMNLRKVCSTSSMKDAVFQKQSSQPIVLTPTPSLKPSSSLGSSDPALQEKPTQVKQLDFVQLLTAVLIAVVLMVVTGLLFGPSLQLSLSSSLEGLYRVMICVVICLLPYEVYEVLTQRNKSVKQVN